MSRYTVTLNIEMDGELSRSVQLRKPMPYQAAKYVAWLKRTQDDSKAFADSADMNDAEHVLQVHMYRAAMHGYIIGKLMSEPPDVKADTPELWGAAVVDHLLESGWDEAEVSAAFDGAYQLCCHSALSIPDMKRVNAVLDFGEAQTA